MVRTFLLRGMLVGLVAGLLAFGFAKILGEPLVDTAISFEEQHSHDADDAAPMAMGTAGDVGAPEAHDMAAAEEELVSRQVQASSGLFTAVMVYGTALGGLFALAFAFAYGRIGPLDPKVLAAMLAAAGFVALVLVPALKYPPNPPAVGAAETIGLRSQLYFTMLLISLAASTVAVVAGRQLVGRLGVWNGTLVAGAVFIGLIVLAQAMLPRIDEVPAAFPASVLWQFRLTSLGIQVILWATIGLLFGTLTERSLMPTGRLAGSRGF